MLSPTCVQARQALDLASTQVRSRRKETAAALLTNAGFPRPSTQILPAIYGHQSISSRHGMEDIMLAVEYDEQHRMRQFVKTSIFTPGIHPARRLVHQIAGEDHKGTRRRPPGSAGLGHVDITTPSTLRPPRVPTRTFCVVTQSQRARAPRSRGARSRHALAACRHGFQTERLVVGLRDCSTAIVRCARPSPPNG